MYIIIDTTGHRVGRRYDTYKAAFSFLIMSQRYDWQIKQI